MMHHCQPVSCMWQPMGAGGAGNGGHGPSGLPNPDMGGAWPAHPAAQVPATAEADWNAWNGAAYYQALPAHTVDWASLAQRWIALKTNEPGAPPPPVFRPEVPPPTAQPISVPTPSPMPPLPAAPPPPVLSQVTPHLISGGEANMDLEEADEHAYPPVKKLPPWIREGLEKMEREKQKKEQTEHRIKQRAERLKKQREQAEQELARDPTKSKFDVMNSESDDDDDSNENEDEKLLEAQLQKVSGASGKLKKSRFGPKEDIVAPRESEEEVQKLRLKEEREKQEHEDHADHEKEEDDEMRQRRRERRTPSPQMSKERSKEEILEEMTLLLKRTLTEVLLDVTASEMRMVAKEVLDKETNLRAKERKPSKSLSTLLAGYGSGSSSDASSNEDAKHDSDSDLEERIKRRKRNFERKAREIQMECEDRERQYKEREKRWIEGNSVPEKPKSSSPSPSPPPPITPIVPQNPPPPRNGNSLSNRSHSHRDRDRRSRSSESMNFQHFRRLAFRMVSRATVVSTVRNPTPTLRQTTPKKPSTIVALSLTGLVGGLFGTKESEGDDEEEESEEVKNLIHNIKLGILAQQEGDLDKSEMLLHIALKQAQDMNHFDGITYVFTVLANLAFERGDYMKAEKTYKDVMKRVMSKGIPAEDNSMIEMSLKLAKVYASWQQHDKAVLGFQFCINTQEKKVKNGDLDENTLALWGMSRDWFAQYLLDNGDYSGAFTEFQNAFLTSCELFGDSHPQSLVLINSLGTVASMMDDQARAVSYFQKAVKLASSEDDENLSTYLVNLGMARIKQ
eukprot:TCALIF_05761-PB protein Name:"Similar to ttc19 Tetratricopeptide repeat protein 19, mitochondrial (Danio rerio)" AED:0.21 eAED:0.21 QI:0/0.57/0.62/0.87/0.71/0.62/8/0/792